MSRVIRHRSNRAVHSALWGSLLAGAVLFSASAPARAAVADRPFFRANSVVIVFGASDFEENGGVAPVAYDFHMLDNATSGQAAPDIIAADGRSINYNTGRFNPIQSGSSSGWEFQVLDPVSGGTFISSAPHQTLDENDAYTAFELDDATDVDLLGGGGRSSRFYVVSNVPFDLFAQSSNLQTSGEFSSMDYSNIRYRLRINRVGGGGVNRWGTNAQDPSVGGAGIVLGIQGGPLTTLDDLSTGPTQVFDGGQRTARAAGSLLSQAVSFRSSYNLRGSTVNGNNYDFSMGAGSLSADVTYTVYTP